MFKTGWIGLFLVVATVLIVNTADSEEWAGTINLGIGDSYFYIIRKTSDNGYILGGYRRVESLYEPCILRLDSTFNIKWLKTYGRSTYAWLMDIRQTSDGGYIAIDYKHPDSFLLRLNSSGEIIWQKKYQIDMFNVVEVSDGLIIGGSAYVSGNSKDLSILKLDNTGTVQWKKTYGGIDYEGYGFIQQTTDGGYIVAGYTYSFGAGNGDIWVLKLDSSGAVEWQHVFGGSGYDYPSFIQQTADGGYIVTGYTSSFGAGSYDIWILKLNNSGAYEWEKTYGGTSNDYPSFIQQTTDGGYIVAGYTFSFGAGGDAWVLKLDNTGILEWQKNYGGADFDGSHYVEAVSGGYIIIGNTFSFGKGRDIWILKVNLSGGINGCVLAKDSSATALSPIFAMTSPSVTPQPATSSPSDGDIIPKTLSYSEALAEQCSYPQDRLVLITPNGRNIISSGSAFNIMWNAPSGMDKFSLKLSIDGGATWLLVDRDITGNSYSWSVPAPRNNKRNCLIKVIGFNSSGTKLGADRSDWSFTIEVLKVKYPNGGEVFSTPSTQVIGWRINETVKQVYSVKLFYTKDGGATWNHIATLTDPSYTGIGDHSYMEWDIPSVLVKKTKCKVKVVLKDSAGNTIGSDVSDGFFTIQP